MRARLLVAALLPALLLAGCGGGGNGSAEDEASAILGDLESLRPGEILIKGLRAPRRSGPYTMKPGGYTLTFEQSASQEASPRLIVALESKPDTPREPLQIVVDTMDLTGKASVNVSGKVYVNVQSGGAPFVLRFTPKSG